mmetsp:Transcript_83537/g.159349  ORF Transcript_83537/g.159349 Transcript_83537/m.159349 type:complete len:379 (+) Transcript_83537:44-1180(+)
MWTPFTREDSTYSQTDESDEADDESVSQEQRGLSSNISKAQEDEVKVPYVELEEDTFGMWVCSLARDAHFVAKESSQPQGARKFRMFTVVFLLIVTLLIQIWLLAKVKQFVSAKAVLDIRDAYSLFELTMCGEDVTWTRHEHARCSPGAFPAFEEAKLKLSELDSEDQADICRIPLSQPYFFATVLLVWTITCISDVRKACRLQMIVLYLQTTESMAGAADLIDDGDDDDDTSDDVIVIRKMTCLMKIVITVTTFIPRVSITVYLLWVGCRWLLGTNQFDELILNAIALEFILQQKDSIYEALVPQQSKEARACTVLHPVWKRSKLTYTSVSLQAFGLLIVSAGWVVAYMHNIQDVLPGYGWDVNSVCEDYILTAYKV